MVALKSAEIDRFIAKPSSDAGLILIFGPDRGLVTERADQLISRFDTSADDPFSIVKLDGADIGSDANRLIDEASTVSMFGDLRVIRVRDIGNRNVIPAVAPLLDAPPPGAIVVIEAGDLKRGTGIRKRVESHSRAIAIACYPDAGRDLERLIKDEFSGSGITVSDAARQALAALLGSDRLVTRSELNKLRLYVGDAGHIDIDDVEAVIGDSSALQTDQVVDMVAGGNLDGLEAQFRRLIAAGSAPDMVVMAALRHFQMLDAARAQHDRGEAADQIVSRLRPPIYFKRRGLVSRQINLWQTSGIRRAQEILNAAVFDVRRHPELAFAAAHNALLRVAAFARRDGSRRR